MTSDPAREIERLRADADYMHFLVAAGELLSSSLDYRSTLRNVCSAAVESVADICILDLGSVADTESVAAAHKDESRNGELKHVHKHLRNAPGRPAHPVLRVLDSGAPFFAPAIDDEWIERHASSHEHAEFMRRMQYRSMIVVPVRSQIWGLSGALTLVRTAASEKPYDDDAIAFAEDLGRRCGVAIGKARLYSRTVDVAERLQKAALPQSLPKVEGVRFDVLYEPADAALLVGGDWYDAFDLPDGNVGISLGDVSGHGIESAAQMSSIRNAIRMALVMERDLEKVLEHADFLFRNEVEEGTFCTTLVGVVDPVRRTFTCASAGHPSPMIWNAGKLSTPLEGHAGAPLAFGALTKRKPRQMTLKLDRGATIVLYTDGLLESQRSPLEAETELRALISRPDIRESTAPARLIRDHCIPGLHADDVALLVLTIE